MPPDGAQEQAQMRDRAMAGVPPAAREPGHEKEFMIAAKDGGSRRVAEPAQFFEDSVERLARDARLGIGRQA